MSVDTADFTAIEQLVVEHAYLLDHARWGEVSDLYVEDGRLDGGPAPLVGRDQFLAWAEQRAANHARRTHHQCTNLRVKSAGDGRAVGSVMLVLHVFDADHADKGSVIELVAEYQDEYVKVGPEWLFARRRIVPLHLPA